MNRLRTTHHPSGPPPVAADLEVKVDILSCPKRQLWVGTGRSGPPRDLHPANLVCWLNRPDSAKSGPSRTPRIGRSTCCMLARHSVDSDARPKGSAVVQINNLLMSKPEDVDNTTSLQQCASGKVNAVALCMDEINRPTREDMTVRSNRLDLIRRYNLSVGTPGPEAQRVQNEFLNGSMAPPLVASFVAEYEVIIESRLSMHKPLDA